MISTKEISFLCCISIDFCLRMYKMVFRFFLINLFWIELVTSVGHYANDTYYFNNKRCFSVFSLFNGSPVQMPTYTTTWHSNYWVDIGYWADTCPNPYC